MRFAATLSESEGATCIPRDCGPDNTVLVMQSIRKNDLSAAQKTVQIPTYFTFSSASTAYAVAASLMNLPASEDNSLSLLSEEAAQRPSLVS